MNPRPTVLETAALPTELYPFRADQACIYAVRGRIVQFHFSDSVTRKDFIDAAANTISELCATDGAGFTFQVQRRCQFVDVGAAVIGDVGFSNTTVAFIWQFVLFFDERLRRRFDDIVSRVTIERQFGFEPLIGKGAS